MDLGQAAELKEMAELVTRIDELKLEKKNTNQHYNKQIELLEKQLLARANEANSAQMSLDLD